MLTEHKAEQRQKISADQKAVKHILKLINKSQENDFQSC